MGQDMVFSCADPDVYCRFQGQDMDVEFIQTLQQQCKRFISERGTATVQELQQFIQNSVNTH